MRWNKSGHAALLVLPDATLYVPSGRRYMLWKAIPTLLMIAFFAGCGYFVHRLQWVWELEQYEGWLYPANDPDPPCSTRFQSGGCNSTLLGILGWLLVQM